MCGTEATVKFPVQLIGTRHSLHINVQDMDSMSLMFGDVIREANFIKVPCMKILTRIFLLNQIYSLTLELMLNYLV